MAHPAAQQVSREEIVKLYYDYAIGVGNGALAPGRRRSSFVFEPHWSKRPWPPRDKWGRHASDEELGTCVSGAPLARREQFFDLAGEILFRERLADHRKRRRAGRQVAVACRQHDRHAGPFILYGLRELHARYLRHRLVRDDHVDAGAAAQNRRAPARPSVASTTVWPSSSIIAAALISTSGSSSTAKIVNAPGPAGSASSRALKSSPALRAEFGVLHAGLSLAPMRAQSAPPPAQPSSTRGARFCSLRLARWVGYFPGDVTRRAAASTTCFGAL